MPGLQDLLAGNQFIQGYDSSRQRGMQDQAMQLQQATGLMALLQHARQQQQEQQFMQDRTALGPNPAPSDLLQLATKYSAPKEVLHYLQQSQDRQAQVKATQEAAMARLQQAATQFDSNWQLRYRAAGNAEERLNLEKQREQYKQALQGEAARLAGAKAQYDFGFQPVAPPAQTVTAPNITAAGMGTVFPPGTTMQQGEAAALTAHKAGLPVSATFAQEPAGVSASPPMQAAAPLPAPVASTPMPATSPPQPNAQVIPTMPPEIASAPKKIRDQWLLAQTKPGVSLIAPEPVVDAIIAGRMQIPTGFALKSPYWQDVIARVAQKDPTFDATKYGARASARRTFASGPEARNVTALNTVIGHLGTLDDAMSALENKDLRLFNTVANRLSLETGHPEVNNFETARQAVSDELMRVFRGSGTASEHEAQRWADTIKASSSPSQLRGNISTIGNLLESRVGALAQQYERTVNQGGNPAQIDPGNQVRLNQFRNRTQSSSVREFASEEEAKAANLPSGARVKIRGVLGTWK